MAKILIVDDEPRIRDLIREHLQYAGFVCEEAGDGGAALAVLAQGGIDLVILDIMMPFMDGMTCLREMRTRLPGFAAGCRRVPRDGECEAARRGEAGRCGVGRRQLDWAIICFALSLAATLRRRA